LLTGFTAWFIFFNGNRLADRTEAAQLVSSARSEISEILCRAKDHTIGDVFSEQHVANSIGKLFLELHSLKSLHFDHEIKDSDLLDLRLNSMPLEAGADAERFSKLNLICTEIEYQLAQKLINYIHKKSTWQVKIKK
jgi:hypothetical protein